MSNASDFIIENGVLKKYVGSGGNVVVPEGVTEIGVCSFQLCETIKSIQLPDGITIIGEQSFSGCKNMEHITLPTSIEKISMLAFAKCISLHSICAPNVKEIESMAFSECKSLRCVDIPDSGVKISNCAFHRCEQLQDKAGFVIWGNVLHSYCGIEAKVVIPNSVAHIGSYAFSHIYRLEEVIIPTSVESIGSYAFGGNDNLRSITIPDSVTEIGEDAFSDNPKLKSIIASDRICRLAWETIDNVNKRRLSLELLETGDIPAGAASYINKNAATIVKDICRLDNVRQMESFLKLKKRITQETLEKYLKMASGHINVTAFLLEYQSTNVEVSAASPLELTDDTKKTPIFPKTAADWKKIFKFSNQGSFLVVIGYKAEMPCITIPANIGKKPVLAIEEIRESIHLQKLIVSHGVKEIRSRAFFNCSNLKEIHLPDSIEKFGVIPFYGCPELTIYAPTGSYAETYAKEHNIPFVAE